MFLTLLLWMGCVHAPDLKSVEHYAECPTRPSYTGTLPAQLETIRSTNDEDNQTGVWMLEYGLEALLLRGWLAEQATQTLDVQYFIFSADNVGLISTAAMVSAAERGVKVRLMVDDVLAHGDESILRDIHHHPNIDVKVYNPNINIGKTLTEKSKNLLTQFEDINQRMHHKTFIVDGKVAITGGRNVGDEYFDLNSDYNFRDRDVALFGGSVASINEGFEVFWDDAHSVPIHQLLKPVSTQKAQQTLNSLRNYACTPTYFDSRFRSQMDAMPERIRQKIQSGELSWTDKVQYISDAPWKNESEGLGGGSITTRRLLDLLSQAERRIWIQTPYLILSDVGLSALQAARDKDIEIKILTNSLAATDNYPAFAGYKKVRNLLEEMGVEVYEMKPNAPDIMAMNQTGLPDKMDAAVGLHSKSMLIDDHISVVGTFNMDPRSANLNTESLVVIRDVEVTSRLAVDFARDMNADNAWPANATNDKEAGLKRRLLTWMSALVPSALL